LLAESAGELVAQLAVLVGELSAARVGCFEAPQQRRIGGSLPGRHGFARCPLGGCPESLDFGSQVRLGVEPAA
jgi:hypothetical protein